MSDTGDYISREYVLKCMEDSYKSAGISAEAKAKMTRWLNKAPAADVRPVVYCRECIHWKKSELVICGNDNMVCDYHVGARYYRHADDFCSKGKSIGQIIDEIQRGDNSQK